LLKQKYSSRDAVFAFVFKKQIRGIIMENRGFWLGPFIMSLSFVTSGIVHTAMAQTDSLPFADPSKMFERMFGEDTEADRIALEKISVSLEDETQFGRQMVQSAVASLKSEAIKIQTEGRDVEYLKSLVATFQPYMRNKTRYKTINVMVAQSPRIDARSYPGGTLIFFDGLLDAAGNEAALAGIVGHELSHLDRGHQLISLKRMKIMEKSFSAPGSRDAFINSPSNMTKLWARPFRPEDERDADRDGVTWSYAAGYDPRELAKLFQKKTGKSSMTEELPWATFFRSHPNDQERQEAILKQFKQLHHKQPLPQPLAIGRENLINRFSRKQEKDAKN
jgi:predicted Zn-dependent protease